MPDSPKTSQTAKPIPWKRYLILGAVALVLAVVAWVFVTSFLPRMWSQAIGSQVNKSFGAGIGWGLFYGFIFTLLPVLVLGMAIFSRWKHMGIRIALVVIAVVLAVPNLLTLAISLGTNGAAIAARQVFNVDAPMFQGSSLVGAILGGLAGIGAVVFTAIRGKKDAEYRVMKEHQKEQLEAAKQQQKAERAAARTEDRATHKWP